MAVIKYLAHIVSLVFHPIFMAAYMLFLLMWINPYLFGAGHWSERSELLIMIIPTSIIIPLICILLMKPLGFIRNFRMEERTERIVPYICMAVLYSWLFININRQTIFPQAYAVFFLGVLIGIYLAFFINNFSKISAHTLGAGGLLGMIVLTRAYYSYDEVFLHMPSGGISHFSVDTLMLIIIVLGGVIGTSRLLLQAHDRNDIYGGYVVGFSAQLIAYQVLT